MFSLISLPILENEFKWKLIITRSVCSVPSTVAADINLRPALIYRLQSVQMKYPFSLCALFHLHKASVSNPLSTPSPTFPYLIKTNHLHPIRWSDENDVTSNVTQGNDSGAVVCNYSRRTCKLDDSRQCLLCRCQADSDWYSWSRGSRRGSGIVLKCTFRSQVCHLIECSLLSELFSQGHYELWGFYTARDSSTKHTTTSYFTHLFIVVCIC